MLKIAQITDLHIGGDYNGKYKVKENFEKVIQAIPKDIDLLIITGDVVDDERVAYVNPEDVEKNYNYVRDFIESNIKSDYLVLGGNHDDMNILKDVFGDNCIASQVQNISFEDGIITLIDTSNGSLPMDIFSELDKNSVAIFTHYPLAKVSHKFMENFELEFLDKLEDEKLPDIFCGHFHFKHDEGNIHVTPSTQCQIDPSKEAFEVASYNPGYRIISIDDGKVTSEVFEVEV